MKRILVLIVIVMSMLAAEAFAGNGDLIVDGKISVGGNSLDGNSLKFQYPQNMNTWWLRPNNAFSDLVVGNTDDLADSNIKFTLNASGNVGIGTTTPNNKLDVAGNIGLINDFNGLHFMSAAGPGDMYLDVEPGTRILRTRNWNTDMPNVGATGIHTGTGKFERDVAIATQGYGVILKATDGANCFRLTVNNAGGLATTQVSCP